MNVAEFLFQNGYTKSMGSKACCPFHDDRTPSAKVHAENNSIYCFACRRWYGPADFYVKFGVMFHAVTEEAKIETEPDFEWGTVLFYD